MVRARRSLILVTLGSACSFNHGLTDNDGGADALMVSDSMMMVDTVIGPDAQLCFGTFINICLTTLPSADLVVDVDRDVNTDTGCPFVFTQSAGSTLCGLVARNVTINARLRANGPRPLVVLATGTITVSGTGVIDVGSYREFSGGTVELVGAGAVTGATLCGSPSSGGMENGQPPVAGGGGAGGSFAGRGGAGASARNGAGGSAGVSANFAVVAARAEARQTAVPVDFPVAVAERCSWWLARRSRMPATSERAAWVGTAPTA
jgi:hypothetical protein